MEMMISPLFGMVLGLGVVTSPIIENATPTSIVDETREFIDETKPYYHYKRGTGAENGSSNRILTLNACMLDGTLPKKYGGMTLASERTKQLSDLIQKHNPDIYLGQELTLETGTLLYEELKDQYPHFWIGMGIDPGNEQSGLFVASRHPIVSEPLFIPFPEWMQKPTDEKRPLERGFFCLETADYWIVTSHMEPGSPEKAGSFRRSQLKYVTENMDLLTQESGKPYLLAGDLNIERTAKPNDEYSQSGIADYYYDYYTERHPEFNEDTFTATNLLTFRANGEEEPSEEVERNEIDDYFLIRNTFKDRFKQFDVQLIRDTYDLSKPPSEAITDHRAYLAEFSF